MTEMSIDNIPEQQTAPEITALGTAVTTAEVASRLSTNLYKQLSDGDDQNVLNAIQRAEVYVGSILRSFSVAFDLDNKIVRELVLLNTIYELHASLGHTEAAEGYRSQSKNIVLANWGKIRDTDDDTGPVLPTAAVANTGRPSVYQHALHIQDAKWPIL